MHHQKMRTFLSGLLSVAMMGGATPSFATQELLQAPREDDFVANANNESLGFGEQLFEIFSLIYLYFSPRGATIQESASAIQISDRSILGIASGALVPITGGVNSCCCAAGVAIDPLGRFVLTTDSARNRVCVHRRDSETGALTPVPGSPFSTGGTSAQRVGMDPAGEFVFVTNSSSNSVTVFSFDLNTGALTLVPGSPFPAGSQPLDVTTDGFGRFLYVANDLSNSISAFSINRSSGVLTPVAGSPFGMGSFLSRVEARPVGAFSLCHGWTTCFCALHWRHGRANSGGRVSTDYESRTFRTGG